jgi:hypothetical protein
MSGAGEAAGGSKLQSPLLAASGPAATSADGDGGHGVSRQLEGILGDVSLPWGRRMAAATLVEMRLLARLAAPAVLVYMINYLMSMSTQIFSGHLGTLELAAASLGNNGIQIFAYGLMVRERPQSLSSETLKAIVQPFVVKYKSLVCSIVQDSCVCRSVLRIFSPQVITSLPLFRSHSCPQRLQTFYRPNLLLLQGI